MAILSPFDWASATLDAVKAYRSENLIGGRGAVARGTAETDAAVEQTRKFLNGMIENVGRVHRAEGGLKAAFEATRDALAPEFGSWPIFEHCLPFDVQRLWDEFDGIDMPRIWTAERDGDVHILVRVDADDDGVGYDRLHRGPPGQGNPAAHLGRTGL